MSLKETILKALTPAEIRVRLSNINDILSDPDPVGARQFEDEHRKAAHGSIDMLLESGRITPDEALQRKSKWDVMHGY